MAVRQGWEAEGLYDPALEHDACGVAFVARLDGAPTHDIISLGLTALENLDHRVTNETDENLGDGAGLLMHIPDEFLAAVVDFDLPPKGSYAAGMAFLPTDNVKRASAKRMIEYIATEENLVIHGWRVVPVNTSSLGPVSLGAMPHLEQLFVSAPDERSGLDLDRAVYPLRQRARNEAGVYFASLSARTTVYKGMVTTRQLSEVFPDLLDERVTSALCLVHSRFSTNTFTAWERAHPYRLIAHNGEINTIRGNRNWMRSREALLDTDLIPGDTQRLLPICTPGVSDSASFDEVLELLALSGRSLPHAVLMMIPEAWEKDASLTQVRRDFYSFHTSLMEPWDGPAALAFTDGTQIGAVVDRNGLRPGRYWVTDDGLVVFASEAGVLPIEPEKVVAKGRLKPGRMLLADLDQHRVIDDDELKAQLAAEHPYGEWLRASRVDLAELPQRQHVVHSHASVTRRQLVFGYTQEELKIVIAPMANTGEEAIGAMGTDTPIAALSERPKSLFDYFSQSFAQVTNPPLDPIREQAETSIQATFGPEANLLSPGPDSCRHVVIGNPILDSDDLAKLVRINRDGAMADFTTYVVRGLYEVAGGGAALEAALERLCNEVSKAIADGCRTIVLSDRQSNADFAPIPSVLLTAAIHHHLVRERTRTQVGLIVEAGDVREPHHIAMLIGNGAAAVNPYLCFETAEDLARREWLVHVDAEQAVANVRKALGEGVNAIVSKAGVSTMQAYTGAQLFEALGLSQEVVDAYFTGTLNHLGGIGLDDIATESARRHARAYPAHGPNLPHRTLQPGGEYQWRREGPPHQLDPQAIYQLRFATQSGRYDVFKHFSDHVDDQNKRLLTLRGLLEFDTALKPVPLKDVEPVADIVKRFSTGAMSLGAIGPQAYETLAEAMHKLGGRANTGEGGEDPARLHDSVHGCGIKQVAAARFGVTSDYLASATDLQIKISQGANPGEGGQLPGAKVAAAPGEASQAETGADIVSPPAHHDVHSIEDLRQLIHDLKCANPAARVQVKLAAQSGVGNLAAGATRAKADVVLISGHDGGTGAASLTAIKHTGVPWELGLAEAQQTLLLNGLRDRVVVGVDGGLKTGKDVVVGALLGADEYSFGTAPLIAIGCIMCRTCHLDTCPAGIATQNPDLQARFQGTADDVVHYFEFVAQEVREWLAKLGFRTLDEAIGHVELLRVRSDLDQPTLRQLDLEPLLHHVDVPDGTSLRHATDQDHGLDRMLDHQLISMAEPALKRGEQVRADLEISSLDQSVGTMLGYEVTASTNGKGLPDDLIRMSFRGTAGQSFGAFVPAGVTLRLAGDANDFLGKGLSGGRVTARPSRHAQFVAEDQVIAGNAVAYGATGGELFLRGQVGERFCVRNSGATAVVEGTGDHACEYMTGGEALILGPTGNNVAAGMTGGVAWVLDLDPQKLCPGQVDASGVDDDGWARIVALLHRQVDETASTLAQQLLDHDPGALRKRFTTLTPHTGATTSQGVSHV